MGSHWSNRGTCLLVQIAAESIRRATSLHLRAFMQVIATSIRKRWISSTTRCFTLAPPSMSWSSNQQAEGSLCILYDNSGLSCRIITSMKIPSPRISQHEQRQARSSQGRETSKPIQCTRSISISSRILPTFQILLKGRKFCRQSSEHNRD